MYSKTCRAKVLLRGGLISIFREVRHCIEPVKMRLRSLYFVVSSILKVNGLLRSTFPTFSVVSVHFPGDQEIKFSLKINIRICVFVRTRLRIQAIVVGHVTH